MPRHGGCRVPRRRHGRLQAVGPSNEKAAGRSGAGLFSRLGLGPIRPSHRNAGKRGARNRAHVRTFCFAADLLSRARRPAGFPRITVSSLLSPGARDAPQSCLLPRLRALGRSLRHLRHAQMIRPLRAAWISSRASRFREGVQAEAGNRGGDREIPKTARHPANGEENLPPDRARTKKAAHVACAARFQEGTPAISRREMAEA